MNDMQPRPIPVEENGISLVEICKYLLSKLHWLLLAGLVLAAVGFFGSKYLITPKYKSEVQMYVKNMDLAELVEQKIISNSDLQASSSLASTYTQILKSKRVLNEVRSFYSELGDDADITVLIPDNGATDETAAPETTAAPEETAAPWDASGEEWQETSAEGATDWQQPDQYGNEQYGGDQYGYDQYGNGQHGNEQYGNDQYGYDQYGNEQYGGEQYGDQYGENAWDTTPVTEAPAPETVAEEMTEAIEETEAEPINAARNIDYETLAKMIEVSTAADSQVLNIVVRSTDVTEAYEVALSFCGAAPGALKEITGGGEVVITGFPEKAHSPYSPNTVKFAAFGFAIGVIILAVILIIEMLMDNTIYLPEDVEKICDIIVLGQVPAFESFGSVGEGWEMKQGGTFVHEKEKGN